MGVSTSPICATAQVVPDSVSDTAAPDEGDEGEGERHVAMHPEAMLGFMVRVCRGDLKSAQASDANLFQMLEDLGGNEAETLERFLDIYQKLEIEVLHRSFLMSRII